MFEQLLAQYIRDNFTLAKVYIFHLPKTKSSVEHNIAVIPTSSTDNMLNAHKSERITKLVVTGNSITSLTRAKALEDFFYPKDPIRDRSLKLSDTTNISNVFLVERPTYDHNEGNVFFASIRLRFFVVED